MVIKLILTCDTNQIYSNLSLITESVTLGRHRTNIYKSDIPIFFKTNICSRFELIQVSFSGKVSEEERILSEKKLMAVAFHSTIQIGSSLRINTSNNSCFTMNLTILKSKSPIRVLCHCSWYESRRVEGRDFYNRREFEMRLSDLLIRFSIFVLFFDSIMDANERAETRVTLVIFFIAW